MDCLSFCREGATPRVGDVLNVNVDYPVCCREGDTFAATVGSGGDFMVMRLLYIIKYREHSAKLRVKVLSLCNRQSYVKPVTDEERQRLRESQSYDYEAPGGDSIVASYNHIDEHTVCYRNSFGGGDVCFYDYVFTDDVGVDHLVQSTYMSFERNEAYFGDKVLGLHEYCPYFPPPRKLSNDAIVPGVPSAFIEPMARNMAHEGVATYLQRHVDMIKNGRLRGSRHNGLYVRVVIDWVGSIGVEGYIAAVRIVLEDVLGTEKLQADTTVCQLYNELVTEMTARSHDAIDSGKYLL